MKWTLLFIFLSFNSFAGDQSSAISNTQEALLAHQTIKEYKNRLEATLMKYNPIDKNTTVAISVAMISLTKGYVNTKKIKNMNLKFENGSLRPDLEYNLRDKEIKALASFNLSF